MTRVIMDHGVSGCFGTKWAPRQKHLSKAEAYKGCAGGFCIGPCPELTLTHSEGHSTPLSTLLTPSW